jgi:hypothetical protein
MRRGTSRSAVIGAFFFALAGCQLLTGTYSVDSTSRGPNCTSVAFCCVALTGAQSSDCEMYVSLDSEAACAAYLKTLPGGTCGSKGGSSSPDSGIISFPDTGLTRTDSKAPRADAKGSEPDVLEGEDGFGGDDSSTGPDADDDSSTPDTVDGTWTLTAIDCNGANLGIDGTATLTISATAVKQVQTLSDGCPVTLTLSPVTISSSSISASNGSLTCGTACTTSDCTADDSTGAVTLPYTVDDDTLDISVTVDTTSCSSGTETEVFTRQ